VNIPIREGITLVVKLKRIFALIVVLSMTACAIAPDPEPVPVKPRTIQTSEPTPYPEPVKPSKPAVQQPRTAPVSKPVTKAAPPAAVPTSKSANKPATLPKPATVQKDVSADVQKPTAQQALATTQSKAIAKATSPAAAPPSKPANKAAASPRPKALQPEISAALQKAIETAPEEKPVTVHIEETPLSLSILPMRFGTIWTLDRRPNPVTKTTECLLLSDPVTIPDGYENTSVQLLLTTGMLYVQTGSNIDLSYPQSGVQIDDGPVWAFDSVIRETAVQLDTHYEEVVSRFRVGKTVTAHLGFWPTWPMTETRVASFSLKGMEDSISRLTECEKM
jgi:hypothetical protein